MTPTPQALCDTRTLAAEVPDAAVGALWRLAEPGRQLDANLVHLPPGGDVGQHAEPALDVLLLVVAGAGRLDGSAGPVELSPGALAWLPRGASRRLAAGPAGLTYLTVHQRRPGMTIGSGPPQPAEPG